MEQNNQKPATKRQLWALYLASKSAGEAKDFRGTGITFDQASKLLDEYNTATNFKSKYKPKKEKENSRNTSTRNMSDDEKRKIYRLKFIEFFSKTYLDRAKSTLNSVLCVESEVKDDPKLFGSGGKKYKIYGKGCAISWLTYRKCKKYEMIYSECCSAYHNECREMMLKSIDRSLIVRLESEGCPINAIFSQDYQFRELENECIKQFLEMNGAKNVQCHVMYD